jgi:hypothetical protein
VVLLVGATLPSTVVIAPEGMSSTSLFLSLLGLVGVEFVVAFCAGAGDELEKESEKNGSSKCFASSAIVIKLYRHNDNVKLQNLTLKLMP